MTNRPRFAVDIDGVLADTDGGLKAACQEEFGIELPWERAPRWVMADVLEEHLEYEQAAWLVGLYRSARFYKGLKPFPLAFEGVCALAALGEVVFVTSRPRHCRGATMDWLVEHCLYQDERVVFTSDKAGVARSLGIAMAFEDAPHHLAAYWAAGIPAYRFAAPYNEGSPGFTVQGWADVIEDIEASGMPGKVLVA